MDPAHIFRQGLGTVPPRQNFVQPFPQQRKPADSPDDLSDGDGSGGRVAHTLTACCRCRQRKTRCDPTLPRCLPCERSGSTCEYLDTAKGRKINRYYVIKLQDKVRALEAELGQYTDEDGDNPGDSEDMLRPGGMVRLHASDETPRYLGPSSGIAMSRLLMEEAKRFTDSNRISELIPEVRARRQARMQSIQMTGPSGRKKSTYPMVSERPAENLPTRSIADKLVDVFNQKAQLFWPALHEKAFQKDLEDVYDNDSDSYKNFVVRMVIAISLQKLDTQYAGLADSYYLAAMQYVEELIRPKDLKTLQCLVLIAQYTLLTPTRTPVYYVIGLATRICQQEGLTDESTIATGYNLNPQTVDMRRRLVWIVAAMELGLAHSMGRPSGFATGDDRMEVNFFAPVDDEHITENGILNAPQSERKIVAIHFYKLRMCQAEIRRTLYERKRPEPRNDSHPWYHHIEEQMKEWLDSSPPNPPWCKPWFTGRFHQMRVFMYRPSPQVTRPSARAASICFDSSAFIINLSGKQLENGVVDITWVFLLTVNMALNTLLWTTSYPEVRQARSREEVEELVNKALDVLDRCSERWPGTAAACQLYAVFSRACLLSYETRPESEPQSASSFASPPAISEPQSSPDNYTPVSNPQLPYLNPPQFGYVFDSPPESMNNYAFDPNFPPPQPTFRSNSIFRNPAADSSGRRFSYFPPDFTQAGDQGPDDPTLVANSDHTLSPPDHHLINPMPTPPDSLAAGPMSTSASSATLSPPGMPMPLRQATNLMPTPLQIPQTNMSPPQKPISHQHQAPPNHSQPPQRHPNYTSVPPSSQPSIQQRPLPAVSNAGDWFNSASPFMSPYNFGSINSNFYNDTLSGNPGYGDVSSAGLGLQSLGGALDGGGPFDMHPGRQGSLTQSQQLELMNVLETEGVSDIDAFLNAGNSARETNWY